MQLNFQKPRSRPTLSLCLLLICSLLISAQITHTANALDSTPSTCPCRTVNYITHSLPQQCLAATKTALTQHDIDANTAQEDSILKPATDTQQTFSTESVPPFTAPARPHRPTALEVSTSSIAPGKVVEQIQSLGGNEPVEIADSYEEESALESGNFLSFEEWKRQNLKKAGQSEHIARRNSGDVQEPRKRPTNVHSSLDALGDDGEIDLDFSGFVPGGPQHSAREVSHPIADHTSDTDDGDPSGPPRALRRSKDAGTTCKERFNYASFDCAANILKTNKEAKSSHAVLLENKDSYMLNQCTAQNKFLILELCNDISIDTVVLANFEFFSSTFRTFRVSVSDRYPVKVEKWKTLGTYEARNTREVQAFLVENPLIWARYVRIEFLTHYGNEFYCPVSLVRIHGTTMMEDWKHLFEQTAEDENEDNDHGAQVDSTGIDSLTPEAIADTLRAVPTDSKDKEHEDPAPTTTIQEATSASVGTTETQDASRVIPASVIAFEAIMSVIEPSDMCIAADSPSATSSRSAPSPAPSASVLNAAEAQRLVSAETLTNALFSESLASSESSAVSGSMAIESKNTTSSLMGGSTAPSVAHLGSVMSPNPSKSSVASSLRAEIFSSEKAKVSNAAAQMQRDKPYTSTTDRPKSGGTATQVQSAIPTMQESFFKSVQKRLQMLEANSSLSLQYIEDQSRALRDAFKKVEQRQLTKTTAFLDQLNQTVLNELRDFRQQYDQLWQSTVIELEMQRERYERDNEAINARLGVLADEVIFQRRMAILQMVLILVCLVLVLFSRGAINNYLELPIVQNVLARSPSSKWLNLSGVESPVHTPPTRARSAHQLRNGIPKGHRRMRSEDSITDIQSGPEAYAPLTPVSDYGQSEVDLPREESKSPVFESDKDDITFDDPEFDPNTIGRPSTSPPVLKVNGISPVSDLFETSEEEVIQANIATRSDSMPLAAAPVDVAPRDVPIRKRLSWDLSNR